jgi:hypothetical protein
MLLVQLFNQQQFDMAMMCFNQSGDTNSALLAKAAHLQKIGDNYFTDNQEIAFRNLKEAAEIFLTVGRAEASARCLVRVGDFQKAGKLLFPNRLIQFC